MFKLLRDAEGQPARSGHVCLPEDKDSHFNLDCEPRKKTQALL